MATGLGMLARYTEMQEVMNLLVAIEECDDTDNAKFGILFAKFMQLQSFTNAEASRIFKTSRPTIGRWAVGDCAPHPVARPAIHRLMAIELEKTLYELLIQP